MTMPNARQRLIWPLAGVFGLLLLIFGSIGLWLYQHQQARFRRAAQDQLISIAKLKLEQIQHWRGERLADGQFLGRDPAIRSLVERLLNDPNHPQAREQLEAVFAGFRQRHGYQQIWLTDGQSRLVATFPQGAKPLPEPLRPFFQQAQAARQPILSDLLLDTGATSRAFFSVVIPYFTQPSPANGRQPHLEKTAQRNPPPLGFLVMLLDPRNFLYPLLRSWPVPSATAETLLVRRDGKQVLYLNDLRYRSNTSLTLRQPLSQTNLLAAQAILGANLIARGLDYRQQPVLGVAHAVPDTPWYVIAKVDLHEVRAPLREHALLIAAIYVALILAAALGTGMLWQYLDAQQRRRSEQALKVSEEKYRRSETMLAHAQRLAHLGGWELDLENLQDLGRNPLRWSDEVFRIFGYPPGGLEVTRENFLNTVHPADRAALIAASAQAVATRQSYGFEHRIRRPDGTERIVCEQAEIICDTAGQPLRMVGTVQDITERKQAESALEQKARELTALNYVAREINASLSLDRVTQSTIESLHALLLPDLVLLYLHEAGKLKLYRTTPHHGAVPLEPSSVRVVAACLCDRALRELQPLYAQDIHCDPRCTYEECQRTGLRSFAALPLRSGADTVGVLGLGSLRERDFQAQAPFLETLADQLAAGIQNARLHEAVQHHAAELEQRVQERTAQLETANKELESFSYSVSHDLRAPLRAINAFSQMLMEEHAAQLSAEAAGYVKIVQDCGQKMGRLIDDLLAFSRYGRTGINRGPVNMEALVKTALQELWLETKERSIDFKIGELPDCQADPTLLKQVWLNLLANAVKYTRQRHPALIEVGGRQESGQAVFFVRDNGVGFNMRYVDKLFGVFQRLHSESEFEGTGVGLAIVARIVNRHGGRVWAESEENHGATFTFSLPLDGQAR